MGMMYARKAKQLGIPLTHTIGKELSPKCKDWYLYVLSENKMY